VSALYVTLNNLPHHHGHNLSDSLRVDFDANGTPIGVEVLGVDWGSDEPDAIEGLHLKDFPHGK